MGAADFHFEFRINSGEAEWDRSVQSEMKTRVAGKGGVRRPLQSRSAENISSRTAPGNGGSRCGLKSQAGCVGKSRSAEELASCSRPLSPPREPTRARHGSKRQATNGTRHGAPSRDPPAGELAPQSEEERERGVEAMHREFRCRRKAVLNGLPPGCSEEELDVFLESYCCRAVSKLKERSVRIIFSSSEAATEQLPRLNSAHYDGCKLTANFGHPDSLLFVGNLSSSFSREELLRLFQPHGSVIRCFVVSSPSSGLGKGYGFVEFATRDEAAQAKLALATRVVGQRSLRVDFADNGMQTCDDLQSRTLFVDRLPKGFVDDDALRDKFSTCGIVNFCQVALTATGVSRGFAFIDMSTWQEAELAQERCNGAVLSGHEIRVSFGMPCRPGACILQHKNTITIPFINGRPFGSTLHLSQKENNPNTLGQDFCPQPTVLQFTMLPPMTSVPYKPRPLQLDATRPEFVPDPSFMPSVSLHSLTSINRIVQSCSAPEMTPHTLPLIPPPPSSPPYHTSTAAQSDDSSFRLSRKRCASALDSAVEASLMGVYDRPYIGQHQQGIPFTHPLKRIKTSPDHL